jgi:hypothetical protein
MNELALSLSALTVGLLLGWSIRARWYTLQWWWLRNRPRRCDLCLRFERYEYTAVVSTSHGSVRVCMTCHNAYTLGQGRGRGG